MSRLDWQSICLSCTADADWRRKIWIGGWLLMLPFVGWPLVLGYRRAFAVQLVGGGTPLLAEWRGALRRHLCGGLQAMGVIHAYYLPLYAWLAWRTTGLGAWAGLPWAIVLAIVVCWPIFSTLVVPLWLFALRSGLGGAPLAPVEAAALAIAYVAATFFLPAAFLQVSRTGHITSAFALGPAWRTVRAGPRRYFEAWLGSGLVSLGGHICLPLSPWGVVWCYLAIVHAFNEVPLASPAPNYLRSAHLVYFRRQHWQRYTCTFSGWLERYERRATGAGPLGIGAMRFAALRIGPLRLPLPGSGSKKDELL